MQQISPFIQVSLLTNSALCGGGDGCRPGEGQGGYKVDKEVTKEVIKEGITFR